MLVEICGDLVADVYLVLVTVVEGGRQKEMLSEMEIRRNESIDLGLGCPSALLFPVLQAGKTS